MADSVAKFGRTFAFISAIIATILSIIAIIVGISYLVKSRDKTGEQKQNDERLGVILIVVSIIIIAVSWFWVWATRRSTFLADISAISGASDIYKEI